MERLNHLLAIVERARDAAAEREKDPAWIAECAARAERDRREAAEWPYRASGIAGHIKPADLEMLMAHKLEDSPAAVLVRKWIRQWREPQERTDRWRPWLWLGGPCGTGKTMAAAEAIGMVSPSRESPRARYVTFRELINAHRNVRSFDRDTKTAAVERLEASTFGAFVVLDEVGQEAEADRDLARQALADFVEHRQSDTGLTLILTNKGGAEIRRRFSREVGWYDERTESRLRALLTRSPSGGAFLDIKGQDMRGEPC